MSNKKYFELVKLFQNALDQNHQLKSILNDNNRELFSAAIKLNKIIDSTKTVSDIFDAKIISSAFSQYNIATKALSYNGDNFRTGEEVIAKGVVNNSPGLNAIANALLNNFDVTARLDSTDVKMISSKIIDSLNKSKMLPVLEQLREESWSSQFSDHELISIVNAQQHLIIEGEISRQTDAISSMLNCFQEQQLCLGYESLMNGLQRPTVEAPDFALLRSVKHLSGVIENLEAGSLPSGTKTFARNISSEAARRLSRSESTKIDLRNKQLYLFDDTNTNDFCQSGVDASTYNVLSSALNVFEELSEKDMYELQNYCDNTMAFALRCHAGKFIWDAINHWKDTISFDRDCYFHARLLKKDACPLNYRQMEQAPDDYVSSGRYNEIEHGCYYFADTKEGAKSEIGKHEDAERIQIAEIEGIGDVAMIDFSPKGRDSNYFLKSIRYPHTDNKVKIPREYMIPNFVAQCCKMAKLDGIKYYRSEKYHNYVLWNDDKVRVRHMFIYPDEQLM